MNTCLHYTCILKYCFLIYLTFYDKEINEARNSTGLKTYTILLHYANSKTTNSNARTKILFNGQTLHFQNSKSKYSKSIFYRFKNKKVVKQEVIKPKGLNIHYVWFDKAPSHIIKRLYKNAVNIIFHILVGRNIDKAIHF